MTLTQALAQTLAEKTSHNYRRLSWNFSIGILVNGADNNRLYLYHYRANSHPCKATKLAVIDGQWNPTLEDLVAEDWELL